MTKTEKRLEEVAGMLRKLTWAENKRTGVPFDELFSEACFIFMRCCGTYDPEKGMKFSSWCYSKVYFHLKHYTRAKFQDRHIFVEEISDSMLPPAMPAALRSSLREQTKSLSPEAQDLIRLLVESPRTDDNPKEMLRDACRALSFEHGFNPVEVSIILNELQHSDWLEER